MNLRGVLPGVLGFGVLPQQCHCHCLLGGELLLGSFETLSEQEENENNRELKARLESNVNRC